MTNFQKFFHKGFLIDPISQSVKEINVVILAHKCEPAELPEALQDPKVATILLSELKKDIPALVFQWNDAGFNDVPNMPNCRNGILGQTKAANLVANRAVNWDDTVFTFPNGTAIGRWVGVPDICHSVTRITKISATNPVDVENFDDILRR
ncbi:22921_t:CDS:2 [Dentiscutata erythropus]|uniref:22921_t:CDS:1 n=1 Tax=Dentiscutata erythropus TaxID=1348616 RepID=A0A9N9CCW2_9GLOM|nr:22921_t:CDS:2 [Dentiscutata erythropus]